jgi:hypothetical protein
MPDMYVAETSEHRVLISHDHRAWMVSVSRLDRSRVSTDAEALAAIEEISFVVPAERLEAVSISDRVRVYAEITA